MSSRATLRHFAHLVVFVCTAGSLAAAERRGVLANSNPIEARAEKDSAAAVVGMVRPDTPFSFAAEANDEWSKVSLASGASGWIPTAAIRLHFDTNDLPRKDPQGLSEIDEAARRRGFDYVAVTRRAARGEPKALTQFFALAREADGAAAESIYGVATIVYHLLGDARFAKYLAARPLAEQMEVRNLVVQDAGSIPTPQYLQRNFPETTRVLFRREIVGWPSPDGRFAIRKVFTDEFDLRSSRVTLAQLIEKKTGEVVSDLTADDIGTGADREGAVLWAPDSKRFACLSMDLTAAEGNLFSTPRPPLMRKVTTVYAATEEGWRRVDLPLAEVPGRAADSELEGAIAGHEFTEPIRWLKPNVLRLERHEYYEKLKPTTVGDQTFEAISQFARWYDVTATIDAEGRATLKWKARTND